MKNVLEDYNSENHTLVQVRDFKSKFIKDCQKIYELKTVFKQQANAIQNELSLKKLQYKQEKTELEGKFPGSDRINVCKKIRRYR